MLFQYVFNLGLIITSKTRLAVMRFYLANPAKELGVRETARALDINPMQVRNELILLQEAGLLKSRPVANSVQYSLDAACPAVGPFKLLLNLDEVSLSPSPISSPSVSNASSVSNPLSTSNTPSVSNASPPDAKNSEVSEDD